MTSRLGKKSPSRRWAGGRGVCRVGRRRRWCAGPTAWTHGRRSATCEERDVLRVTTAAGSERAVPDSHQYSTPATRPTPGRRFLPANQPNWTGATSRFSYTRHVRWSRASPFCIQNLLFTQPTWQPRTNNYNVSFLMNLHSPFKSNTNSSLHKFLASFWYVCLSRLPFPHPCRLLCKECSQFSLFNSWLSFQRLCCLLPGWSIIP